MTDPRIKLLDPAVTDEETNLSYDMYATDDGDERDKLLVAKRIKDVRAGIEWVLKLIDKSMPETTVWVERILAAHDAAQAECKAPEGE